jgi:NAD(P)-dependent dehydrogenase (short-subunit alcohol dehydrogenase family)
MVARTTKEFSRIDILVNCAGGANYMPLLDMSQGVWDETLALNITGVYLCSRAAGRVMVEQKSGSIVNFSSAVATAAVANMVHYAAAKAAVNQFTRVLAAEWGPYNIRVNAISPGLTDTSHTREVMGPELFELYAKAIPLGRAGQPEDILAIAIFLASDASSYISGAIVPVSGGPQ